MQRQIVRAQAAPTQAAPTQAARAQPGTAGGRPGATAPDAATQAAAGPGAAGPGAAGPGTAGPGTAASGAAAPGAIAARTWQTVLQKIETRLRTGGLAPGDHLPPERTLAAELEVGRSSVREALRVLEVLGLVRTATGSGPSAGAVIVATPNGAMGALLRLHVAAQGFPVADIVRTRLLMEAGVVDELARRSEPVPALEGCRTLLAAMDEEGLPAEEFLALDTRFHVGLAEATGNTVVTAMMAGLRESIESYVRAGAQGLPDWAATAARLRREHRGVLEAIDRRRPDAAREQIRRHITGYYADMT